MTPDPATATAAVSPAAYRTALALIDEGTRSLARLYKDVGSSEWKAKLLPLEHAGLALRLAHALTADDWASGPSQEMALAEWVRSGD